MTTYTKVPNTVFEKLLECDINLTEHRVLLFIIRYTLGFNRKSAQLSSSFISNKLKAHKVSVQKAVTALIQKGLIKEYQQPTYTMARVLGLSDTVLELGVSREADRGVSQETDRSVSQETDRGVSVSAIQENKYINKTINKTNKEYTEKNWSGYNKENSNSTFDPEEFFLAAVEKSMRMTGG